MPSEARRPLLAEPPGWRIHRRISLRNAVSVDVAQAPGGHAAILKRIDLATADHVARLRFERERRMARTMIHPGLANRLGDGEGWIAFERLPLRLEDRPDVFGQPSARTALLAGVAGILAYLHGRGVVHQDLKPAHVLFRQTGEVVLVDLGSAGLVSGDPIAGYEAVGAEAWAAPEQLAGAPPTAAADLWSLARLALWLAGETRAQALPAPLGALIGRCLAPEPDRRPSAATVLRALREF